MIEQVYFTDVATFQGRHDISNLKLINYLFGGNGVGKSTIARLIGENNAEGTAGVVWKNNLRMEVMVYDRHFVDSNYSKSDELSGVFMLGAQSIELQQKTDEALEAHQEAQQELDAYQLSLKAKYDELAAKEEGLNESFWEVKKRHEAEFGGAFEGSSSAKERFKKRVLAERESNNSEIAAIADLRRDALVLFGIKHDRVDRINDLEFSTFKSLEQSPLLKQRIVGKADVDISALVSRLGNSDWVFRGRDYLKESGGACPFCQQSTSESLSTSIEGYFDDSFVSSVDAIKQLEASYREECHRISTVLDRTALQTPRHLNREQFLRERDLFNLTIKANLVSLEQKRLEPGRAIVLQAAASHLGAIKTLFDTANKETDAYNEVFDAWDARRKHLTGRVWRYLLDNDLAAIIGKYMAEKDACEKAIKGIQTGIEKKKGLLGNKTHELRQLQKQAAGVQPTIDGINHLLSSFGFQGFRLALGSSNSTYKIVRNDGSSAKNTLSEGEKTFITFLYFFHLIQGNRTAEGISADRVVVFDDPVSSLDSNVLHVVSSLIKSCFRSIQSGKGSIKQVFVFTHNSYFHKEVSFFGNKQVSMDAIGFWHIRKRNSSSTITPSATNPVRTRYEMLWAGLAGKDFPAHALPNVLRRILEASSRLLGGMNVDEIYKGFEGEEREACRVLLSWINDGSHFAIDDDYVSDDDQTTEMYLAVFRKIFEKYGHSDHYNMMMGLS